MQKYVLENEKLRVEIRSQGAEMTSICRKDTNTEYLWCADKKYWGWSSPVLFPIVGGLKDGAYTYAGERYEMKQHGFARHQEFALLSQQDQEIWFALTDSEETRANYPFSFCLEIGYRLQDSSVIVMWRVKNTDTKELYFSIGAHPAFMCPLNGEEKQTDCYLGFAADEINYQLIDPDLHLEAAKLYPLSLEKRLHKLEKDQFARDALIVEHAQTDCVWLAGADRRPYVKVHFNAPLFGVWSPDCCEAPFVCIEPWWGRCDAVGFDGTLEQREYTNHLDAGEVFDTSYIIEICE